MGGPGLAEASCVFISASSAPHIPTTLNSIGLMNPATRKHEVEKLLICSSSFRGRSASLSFNLLVPSDHVHLTFPDLCPLPTVIELRKLYKLEA